MDVISDFKEWLSSYIEGSSDGVIQKAEQRKDELAELTAEEKDELSEKYQEIMEKIIEIINENYTEKLEFQEFEINFIVGLFYLYETVRSAYARIHSSVIAQQVSEEDREEVVKEAVDKAVSLEGNNSFEIELLFFAALAKKSIDEKNNVLGYVWKTKGDDRVRNTHRENEGVYFTWDNPPATSHPGFEYGCRCAAVSDNLEAKVDEEMRFMKTSVNKQDIVNLKKAVPACNFEAKTGEHVVNQNNLSPSFMEDDPSVAVVNIFGVIGDVWDINTDIFQLTYLNGITDSTKEIHVKIDSRGGDLFAGIAMYNFLRNHPAKVYTYNMAQASSAASLIFLAGDERLMLQSSVSLVHEPWSCDCINQYEAENFRNNLRFFSDLAIDIYTDRLNLDREGVAELMKGREGDDGTIINAEKALGIGFANTTNEALPNGSILNNTRDLNNMPKENANNGGQFAGGDTENQQLNAKIQLLEQERNRANSALSEKERSLESLRSEFEEYKNKESERLEEQKVSNFKDFKKFNEVADSAKKLGVELDDDVISAGEASRTVLHNLGVNGAENFTDDTAVSTLEWYMGVLQSNETLKTLHSAVNNPDPKDNENQQGDFNPYAKMKKVGEK